ncbi:DNA-binding transcriptional regulator, LysR family [Pseudomonas chlororaphis]|uniref:putrescine utilization regulator PtrR n=1 Tax=Pseudomonas chlororaphis TaxID=587753 RepID=UPI00087C2057|nr:LysR family transcriptional regulator [Pseudomonas chlororaphis]AZD65457.1 LysR family transcriptional regulator [Pseudomonas chlororaphis subsp. aurantiaca]QIT21587.1 LysR family transcriptional regulator [Pseudomonas chlororaphis subsp. aurantiaca]WDH05740.1 LysR substrate-binding domain-containing protein [Pseudomonas chlororaphis]WDH11505.1 LysR substrate-binding domain-containing protein [Pseudomonas chlororaphis]SDT51727.1 DNA-binding transcriptional regulator, LysR family [Pseudomona
MEFSQLRIFQAVAEEGSITRAAERLHRVPSNLSTRLKQLEEQLGVELFLRERQRLQLSPAGKVLLDYAARLFALRDEAHGAVQGGQPAGDFVLGTMYSTATIQLPALLARYHRAYPAVNLQVQSAPSSELLEGLLAGRLDAVLVDGPLELASLDGVPLCDEKLVLISEADHPPIRSARDVEGRAVFTFRRGCSYRLRLESWFAHYHAAMGRAIEIESYQGMLACVIAGSGVALMSESMLASLPGRESVAVHPLAEPFASATTWLMWRKGMLGANLNAWIELQQASQTDLRATA